MNKRTIPVVSYNDNNTVLNIKLEFKNGINSDKLINIFNNYNYEYYVKGIILKNKNNYELSCASINKCINDIYKLEDNYFNETYVTNGVPIINVIMLAYNDEIIDFLNKNNISYTIE